MAAVREPAVAGSFYASAPAALRSQLERAFLSPLGPGRLPTVASDGPRRLAGLVVPHAGYAYSGPVAAHAYAALAADGVPEVVVLVGPNHYGLGPAVAVSGAAAWRTPLGTLAVDSDLAAAILAALPAQGTADFAHEREHSLEVQLPFLQYLYGDAVRIVPITMSEQSPAVAASLGRALGRTLAGRNAVVIASTDLSHYESQSSAEAKDRLVLKAILESDTDRLLSLAPYRVTACGPGPVAAALLAARELGALRVDLLKYATSGDVSGDTGSVVGYAALALSRP
ncbi:MAG: AmmeMemoRadiSam system protein B [Chloroflexi bacterium]|nr:AmmeMemoRadiSam system protein B [Chloroflexota bacterium]